MARPWFALPSRATEATAEQVIATGAMAGAYGRDPIDGDFGYRRAGTAGREVPYWTREKAATYSVAAYRSNPMATAIIDTYVAFCVGDSGVKLQCTNDDVRAVADEFMQDTANDFAMGEELALRTQLLLGEMLYVFAVGSQSGVVRYGPVEPSLIADIALRAGNPLWPQFVLMRPASGELDTISRSLVQVNDATGLREGEAMYWAPWKTLNTDKRGNPFLMPIIDWLDSYDTVLSNLIDRTALARYISFDVTVDGDQAAVDAFVNARQGTHVPPSGSIEVHTKAVEWKPMQLQTGAYEDSKAGQTVLTSVAAGAGLAKTWLAEPEDANRATSLTMAEPVRRRVGSVQKMWLAQRTELVRFAVDRAVAANRLDAQVKSTDPRTGETTTMAAAQTVLLTGPTIAASDSQLNAQILLNLATGLDKLVQAGALTAPAAAVAARKAWEDYMGIPYSAELGQAGTGEADLTQYIDENTGQPVEGAGEEGL